MIEQWLEEMEVPAVEQRHAHRRVMQAAGGIQSAKPATDDDYVREHCEILGPRLE